MVNTKNSKRSASVFRIHQLLLTVHKELQLIYDATHATDIKGSKLQMGSKT